MSFSENNFQNVGNILTYFISCSVLLKTNATCPSLSSLPPNLEYPTALKRHSGFCSLSSNGGAVRL